MALGREAAVMQHEGPSFTVPLWWAAFAGQMDMLESHFSWCVQDVENPCLQISLFPCRSGHVLLQGKGKEQDGIGLHALCGLSATLENKVLMDLGLWSLASSWLCQQPQTSIFPLSVSTPQPPSSIKMM